MTPSKLGYHTVLFVFLMLWFLRLCQLLVPEAVWSWFLMIFWGSKSIVKMVKSKLGIPNKNIKKPSWKAWGLPCLFYHRQACQLTQLKQPTLMINRCVTVTLLRCPELWVWCTCTGPVIVLRPWNHKPAFKTWRQSKFLEGGVTTWDGFKSNKEVKDDLFVCVWFVRCSLPEVSCHFGIPIRCDGFIFGCFCCIFGSCIFVRCSQETILGPGNSPEVMLVGTVHDTQRPSKSSRILTYLNPHPQTRPTLKNAHKHT